MTYRPLSHHSNIESGDYRYFERVAIKILRLLPTAQVERTRDAIQITDETIEDQGVVILLTPDNLELRLSRVDWTGPHTPTLSSRFWKRINLDKLDENELPNLLSSSIEKKKQQLRKCQYCDELFPPEHMITKLRSCHGCASKYHGVIY